MDSPPPIPDSGLPQDWSIEQWNAYGHAWIQQQELEKKQSPALENKAIGNYAWDGEKWAHVFQPPKHIATPEKEIIVQGKYRCPDCGWRGDKPKYSWWHDFGVRAGSCPNCEGKGPSILNDQLLYKQRKGFLVPANMTNEEYIKNKNGSFVSQIVVRIVGFAILLYVIL